MTQATFPPANPPEDTLRQIRQEKASLLNDAFCALLLQERAVAMFKAIPDEHSYLKFWAKFHKSFGRLQDDMPSGPLIAREPATLRLREKLSEIGQALQMVDYQPPGDPGGQLIHLKALWHLYNEDCVYPPTIKECLDFSFTKLIIKVTQKLIYSVAWGERDHGRTKKTSSTVKIMADSRNEIILAVYNHGAQIPPGISFNKVCEILERQFEESRGVKDTPWGPIPQKMKFPTRDTIMTLFTAKGIIERDFIKRGRFWITNT